MGHEKPFLPNFENWHFEGIFCLFFFVRNKNLFFGMQVQCDIERAKNRVATRWAKWPKVGSLNEPFKVGYLKKGPFQVGYS